MDNFLEVILFLENLFVYLSLKQQRVLHYYFIDLVTQYIPVGQKFYFKPVLKQIIVFQNARIFLTI